MHQTGSAVRVSGLTSAEVRVLGCLLEKQRTTPDAYPLSLNALRLACNQSTNRDPVLEYDDAEIRDGLHRLERRGLTRLASGAGSRAAKYRHLLADALPMDGGEQALLCVLMLRGAQTPGELKQRSERMHAFGELIAVHDALERMIERGLVARLHRRPGQKEERYGQLLQDDEQAATTAPVQPPAPPAIGAADGRTSAPDGAPLELLALHERLLRVEREVAELRGAEPSAGGVGEGVR